MTKINNKYVEEMDVKESGMRNKVLRDGTIVWAGPWLKDKAGEPVWFDNYTECLYANIDFNRITTLKEHGLNEQGQTPEQEKDFKKRMEEAMAVKKKAELAAEMARQNK